MKRIVLLGATGSIGESTLRVVAAHPGRLRLAAVAARSNWQRLAAIAREFGVRQIGIFDEQAYRAAKASDAFPPGTRLIGGLSGLVELAQLPEADTVLVAVVGTVGLEPALAALKAGKELALASKEILVLAGRFIMAEARARKSKLMPLDSEHRRDQPVHPGAPGGRPEAGHPHRQRRGFARLADRELAQATPADALRHPNWAMGKKITIDSATLANKGMELIEAQWLFDLKPEQCTAVIHPQSLIHCLVEFTDGAMLAQLSPPSMTFPIQAELLHPHRAPGVEPSSTTAKLLSLEFRPVDEVRYPMMRLAREVKVAAGVAPAAFNAANEVAVQGFLEARLPFLAISQVVEQTLAETRNFEPADLPSVMAADAEARRLATQKAAALGP